jgi:uncharacterized protein
MDNKIFAKVFGWVFIGLFVTFVTALYVSLNPNMIYNIFENDYFYLILLVQIGIAIYLSARIGKMSNHTAKILYIMYTVLTGLTFSLLFIVFEMSSLIFVFGITSLIFGIFALIGYYTNVNLTKFSSFFFMALISLLVLYLVNMLLGSIVLDLGLTIFGIFLFIGFIAYDVQKVKVMMTYMENEDNVAIYGAFQLYLDFINLFIRLLTLFGKRRD